MHKPMAFARFLLEVACLLSSVAHASQCEWTSCENKLSSAFQPCPGGKTESQQKDCGTEFCSSLTGCTFTHTTRLCCDDSCPWYDFSCHGDALKDFFEDVTDDLKSGWAALSGDVKNKLGTADLFKTLTTSELKSLSKEVLAEVKSIAGITSPQLKEIVSQVKSFDLTQFQAFMKNVAPSSLADAMADLVGSSCSDGELSKAEIFRSVLESPFAWGDESSWSAENITVLGCIIGNFSTDALAKMADDALAAAGNLQSLVSKQLSALTDKFSNMGSTDFAKILNSVNKSEMKASIKAWGQSAKPWGFEKVAMIRTELVKTDAWGQVKNWAATHVSDLGSLITFLDSSDLTALADEALLFATNLGNLSADQIMALGDKIGNMNLQGLSSMLSKVDPTQLHAAMLSSCDISCQSDADYAFLKNPSLTTMSVAIEQSAKRISSRSAAAAETFATSICDASLLDSVPQAMADLQAATAVCNGSAAVTASSFLSSWGVAGQSSLLSRLTDADALGNLGSWDESMLSSMCNAFAGMTPANVAKLTAKHLITRQLPNYQLAMAAADLVPSLRHAAMTKLKESEALGSVESWTCTQVAGARELIAGMLPADLSDISVSAVRGLLPGAFSAMSADQVAAFTAEHFKNITQLARNRLSASRLSGLFNSSEKLVAAVCGSATVGSSGCPELMVDVVMSVANTSNATLETLKQQFESMAGVAKAQILSALAASELPVTTEVSRRLLAVGANTNAQITLRASYEDSTTLSASAAAEQTRAKAMEATALVNGAVEEVVHINLKKPESSTFNMDGGVLSAPLPAVIMFSTLLVLLGAAN